MVGEKKALLILQDKEFNDILYNYIMNELPSNKNISKFFITNTLDIDRIISRKINTEFDNSQVDTEL